MAGALAIDDNGSGSVGSGQARSLGGRVINPAGRARVNPADGRLVLASIGNGYWLAWWPDTTAATTVVASDATGAILATVPVE